LSFCRTNVIPSRQARDRDPPGRGLSFGTTAIPRFARDDNAFNPSRAMSTLSSSVVAIAAAFATLGTARSAAAPTSIDPWLGLGTGTASLPFGAPSSDSARLEAFRLPADKGWPSEGGTVTVPGGAPLRWQPGNGAATNGSVVFAAAYVTADRWTRATLQV